MPRAKKAILLPDRDKQAGGPVDYRVDSFVRHVQDGICILLIHVHSFVMELRRDSTANSFCVEGL